MSFLIFNVYDYIRLTLFLAKIIHKEKIFCVCAASKTLLFKFFKGAGIDAYRVTITFTRCLMEEEGKKKTRNDLPDNRVNISDIILMSHYLNFKTSK